MMHEAFEIEVFDAFGQGRLQDGFFNVGYDEGSLGRGSFRDNRGLHWRGQGAAIVVRTDFNRI
ncbi:hypothetical protein [Hoeflea sp. IMCC20628]|uniref:hypothetical protein n=1 Tax=Hoeflea sp. IMCC20628 TaxID=1620421 RepID=UPI001FDA43B6|nr:hypothetical protein [Hoeflea sp. IMCC20628]